MSPSSKDEADMLRNDLNREIEGFDRSSLAKQGVYLVSCSLVGFGPKTHGFIAVGFPGNFGRVYHCGPSAMLAGYEVTNKLLDNVMKSNKFDEKTKAVMTELKGQFFPSVEHFLRKFLSLRKPKLNEAEILAKAAFPDNNLQLLVALNERKGAVLPLDPRKGRRRRDQAIFEGGGNDHIRKNFPNIDPENVRDVFNQQKLYAQYLQEKAGIGKTTDLIPLYETVRPERTSEIISSFASYTKLPKKSNMFSTNCNKTSASLLQAAERKSAQQQQRSEETIKGISIWSIGSTQRAHVWDPLQISLKTIVNDLINKNKLDENIISKQKLVEIKNSLFHIVLSLPREEQVKALSMILNKNTVIGEIFHAAKKGSFLKPGLSHGILQILKYTNLRLQEFKHEEKSHNTTVKDESNSSSRRDSVSSEKSISENEIELEEDDAAHNNSFTRKNR